MEYAHPHHRRISRGVEGESEGGGISRFGERESEGGGISRGGVRVESAGVE